jgi:hypothetical protein
LIITFLVVGVKSSYSATTSLGKRKTLTIIHKWPSNV